MNNSELEDLSYSPDYDINVRIIAFAVVTIVLIVVMIFFIKTYATQKQQVLKMLDSESQLLETFCKDTFNHNLYIMNLLSSRIKLSNNDLNQIYSAFRFYENSGDISSLLGWKEIVLLNSNLIPVVSSKKGILDSELPMNEQYTKMSKKEPGKAFYGTDTTKNSNGQPLVYAAMGLQDANHKFLGSILIKHDMSILNSQLKAHKKNDFTNFVLIDRRYRIILQSKPIITGVGIEHGRIANKYTEDLIHSISTKKDDGKEISYLDMVNGVNYFIKKIDKEPFLLLVNIDHDEIKTTIFHTVIMKFLEISIFASFFLLMIVSIYRRETWLRSRAEVASRIAIRATTAKSDFLAFTAHEIRSPLGFIMTGSEIMQKNLLGPLPQAYKEYVDGIYRNSSLILEFITDILDEEHIISGNFKIVNTVHNISDIINEALKNTLSRYSARKIEIKKDFQPDLPKLMCDGRRMLQVFSNLISNAIKYSNDNTTVSIKTYLDNQQLVFEIKDQGIGMTDEEIKIAFTKYGTVRKEHFNFIESYGLGLPIVKLLLDAHDATTNITSEINVGTTISIRFPKYKLTYKQA